MDSYNTERIRNVGSVGHGETGKTQLVSSLLFTAGMTPRLGQVAEGAAVTDWDEEEIARKISINSGLAFAEWQAPGQTKKAKINLFDNPGYSPFINETKSSLIAADNAVQVPFAEMLSYANELISMTQGRGSYSMEFSNYDFLPGEIADKVIALYKAEQAGLQELEPTHPHSRGAHS